MRAASSLNLLVIGYSGLDREVLKVLRESERPVRRMLVANGTEQKSLEAAGKFAEALGTGGVRTDWVFDGGFSKLVSSGALHDFLATTPPD